MHYAYDFMPKGIIGRFIVRKHKYINNVSLEAWRSGVILHWKETKAEVQEVYGKSSVQIRVQGPQPKELMTLIKNEFEEIHETFPNLRVQAKIPCICSSCRKEIQNSRDPHFFLYDKLLERIRMEKETAECISSFEHIRVEDLIDYNFTSDDPDPKKDSSDVTNVYNFHRDIGSVIVDANVINQKHRSVNLIST